MMDDFLTNIIGKLINSDVELKEKLKAKVLDAINEADIKSQINESINDAIEYTLDDMDLGDCIVTPIKKYIKQTLSNVLVVTTSKGKKADD